MRNVVADSHMRLMATGISREPKLFDVSIVMVGEKNIGRRLMP